MSQRDATTSKYFNDNIFLISDQSFVLNGVELDTTTIARLTGAIDGSYVLAYLQDGELVFEIDNPEIVDMMQRTIVESSDGFNLISNDIFILHEAYRGMSLGLRSFAREAREAQRIGFRKIFTKAAGSAGAKDNGFSGWYVWARAGFNAELTSLEVNQLANHSNPALRSARCLHDLMDNSDGVAWWKSFGRGRHMEFDLSTGSKHWYILNQYLSEKGVQI
jgi:hypothetical protein